MFRSNCSHLRVPQSIMYCGQVLRLLLIGWTGSAPADLISWKPGMPPHTHISPHPYTPTLPTPRVPGRERSASPHPSHISQNSLLPVDAGRIRCPRSQQAKVGSPRFQPRLILWLSHIQTALNTVTRTKARVPSEV